MNLPVQTGRYNRAREAMRSHIIEESGGTNVGAASGSYAVDVAGDVNVSGGYYINGVPISTGAQTPWSSDINAATHNLTNVGLLGVGTTTPAFPVDVNGDINCTGTFRVNGAPFSPGVPTSRQIIAGAGLGGGGDLTADVTLTANVVTVFGRTGPVIATAGDYTAAQVTNAVSTIGSYPNPAWITSLAWSKITGAPAAYVLPAATVSLLGGVKIGSGVNVAADGTISVTPGAYTLPPASAAVLGGVKIGANVSVGADGTISVAAPGTGPAGPQGPTGPQGPAGPVVPATATVLGGVKIGANISVAGDGTISVAAPGAGSQTPWTSDINAAGHNLSNAGKVGIGTTSPVQALHVIGAGQTTPSVTFDAPATATVGTSADVQIAMGTAAASPWAAWLQSRQSGNSAWGMALNPMGGNVGIGNIAPAYPLDVTGDIHCTGSVRTQTIAAGAATLSLNTNAVTRLAIDTAGHVTINAPDDSGYALTANNMRTNSWVEAGITGANGFYCNAYWNGSNQVYRSNGAAIWIAASSSSVPTAIFAAPVGTAGANVPLTQMLTFAAPNHVGVLQSSPAYALDVTGDINCTGVFRVNGTPIATGGAQTPWASDIDAAGHKLNNIVQLGGPGTAGVVILLPQVGNADESKLVNSAVMMELGSAGGSIVFRVKGSDGVTRQASLSIS